MSSTPRLQDQFTLLLVRLCCSLYSSFLNQSLLLYQLLSYLNFNGLYFKPSIIFKFANLICNIPLILIIFSYLHFNPYLCYGWGARPYKAPFEREGFIYHYRLEVFWNSLQVIFEWLTEMIWDCIASDALRLMIGLENSRHPLGPSDPTGEHPTAT